MSTAAYWTIIFVSVVLIIVSSIGIDAYTRIQKRDVEKSSDASTKGFLWFVVGTAIALIVGSGVKLYK